MVNNLPANAGDVRDADLIPGFGRSPGEGNGTSVQYSALENPMDRGALQATVHRVSKSWTELKQLSKHMGTLHEPACCPNVSYPHIPSSYSKRQLSSAEEL